MSDKNIEIEIQHSTFLDSFGLRKILGYTVYKNNIAVKSVALETDRSVELSRPPFELLHTPDKNRRLFVKLCFEYEIHLKPIIKAISEI